MKANTVIVLNGIAVPITVGSFSWSTLFSKAFSDIPKLGYGIAKY